MNTAELFVQCLENEGCEVVYGLPGEENAHLALALDRSPIRLILTRHEQGAAFMADVHGRLTGQAGVCLATLGPGATNLVTGVASGNMDRSPMVVITGQAELLRQHKESHQSMDVVGMLRPLTKWATPVRQAAAVPEVVRKAFKLATMEKPGACHVELSDDLARQPAQGQPIPAERLRRPVPDDKMIDAALARIRKARRPVILAGNGAVRRRASRQLRRFAELTGIGVISTFMGKGAVDRHDPYCLFTVGLQARDTVASVIEDSDLVLTVGYDMVEYPPAFWNETGDRGIVHLDFLPAEVDDSYRVDVEVVGDLGHALWMLNERLEREPLSFDLPLQRAVRQAMLEDLAEHRDDTATGRLRPQKVIWDVRAALGPDDILLSDVGAHKMWVARYYHSDRPSTCLIPNGFCAMGFALPGAIAARLAHPERRVLALCGDGGFLMNVQELETARRVGANVVIMVWVDNAYGLIEWKQEEQFGRHSDLRFGNPDLVALARSFGCEGFLVEDSRDLAGTLEAAFACSVPAVIAVPIDYRENQNLARRIGSLVCPI